jgi:hypothetical protein
MRKLTDVDIMVIGFFVVSIISATLFFIGLVTVIRWIF